MNTVMQCRDVLSSLIARVPKWREKMEADRKLCLFFVPQTLESSQKHVAVLCGVRPWFERFPSPRRRESEKTETTCNNQYTVYQR